MEFQSCTPWSTGFRNSTRDRIAAWTNPRGADISRKLAWCAASQNGCLWERHCRTRTICRFAAGRAITLPCAGARGYGFAGKIARWLREAHGIPSIVNPGGNENGIAAERVSGLRRHSRIFNLRELIALIAGARLYVEQRPGPTHLCSRRGKAERRFTALPAPISGGHGKRNTEASQRARYSEPFGAIKYVSQASRAPFLSIRPREVRDACEELLAS